MKKALKWTAGIVISFTVFVIISVLYVLSRDDDILEEYDQGCY